MIKLGYDKNIVKRYKEFGLLFPKVLKTQDYEGGVDRGVLRLVFVGTILGDSDT